MTKTQSFWTAFGLTLLLTALLYAAEPTPKPRVSLPTGWTKLGLSSEQKDKVTKIKNEAAQKVKDLQAQIAAVKEKAQEEELAILTESQKQLLAEQVTKKAGLKTSPKSMKEDMSKQ
jgi:hypothetical protein